MLDWDILNSDCDDLTGWTDGDTGTGVSTQETFDSRSTFKLSCPNADVSLAYRYNASVAFPDTFTFETTVYLSNTNGFGLDFGIYTTSGHRYQLTCYNYAVALRIATTNPQLLNAYVIPYDGVSPPPSGAEGTNLLGRWNTYRLVVNAGRVADVWVNDRCYIANQVCTATSATTTQLDVFTASSVAATPPGLHYVDTMKVDTTPEAPLVKSAFRINGQDMTIRTAHKESWEYLGSGYHTWVDIPKLRIRATDGVGDEATCGVPLVAKTDTNASKIMIYDGSATKSLQKLPT